MLKDHIQRGDYTYQIVPRIVFTLIRIADPFVGVLLIIYWADRFNNPTEVLGNSAVTLFFACLLLAALQQLHWVWVLSRERFSWFMALFPWNNALDWLWTYFLSQALNHNLRVNIWITIGALFFLAGTLIELTSNLQLHQFKSDPKNRGKLFTDGLFAVVIHPNYAGYMLWRSSLALMTGYPVLAGIALIFHFAQFYLHAHPPFHRYMLSKYGRDWERYTAKRKKLVPGLL